MRTKWLVILLINAWVPFWTPPAVAQDLTISAAVSLKEALTDVGKLDNPAARDADFNFGATGHLLAQIREGAPVDVFIAASDAQMDQAAEAKLILSASRQVIATNSLVLIAPADSKIDLKGFEALGSDAVKRLALGEPKAVPAGEYAMQVLKHLKLDATLSSRMVFGASVRQVLDYVERGEVDAGIVYTTDAKQSGPKVRVIATADASWHEPIHYPAAIVATSKHADLAAEFIHLLATKPAQVILERHGFALPPATQPTNQAANH